MAKKFPVPENTFVEAYLAGEGIPQIASRLKCSRTLVSKILSKHEVPIRSRKVPPSQRDQISVLFQAGHKVKDIAAIVGINESTVYVILHELGKPKKQRKVFSVSQWQEAMRLYESGLTCEEIGSQMGTHKNTVANNFQRLGVKRRDKIASQILWRTRKNPNYKYGHVTNNWGYVEVKTPDHPKATRKGYVREHILVWEARFGSLPDGYIIHHLNGVKDDNRIENLVALPTKAHGFHKNARHKDKLIASLRQRIRELESQQRLF